jgi:phosphatidylinositol alpha-mannosyltransferase
MLKIAVIQRFLPSQSRGGVGHFTHGLCNTLTKRGHVVTVFSQDPAPQDALYEVVVLPSTGSVAGYQSAPLTFSFQVARQDFSKFDVIHGQGDDHWIRRLTRPPLVRTMHGSALSEAIHNGWRLRSPKRFLMHLYFYGCELIADVRADAVVAVSADTRRYYPRVHEVIPNGVDIDHFSLQQGEKTPYPSILFVGELDSRKRGRLLLQAFQDRVRPHIPNAELRLVCPEKVEGDGVKWLGQVDAQRLAKLYREAWVFCLPSSYEGFGRPYVEAMAAGTAVLATPNPGAKEVLENGRCGLIVPEEQLGNTLCALLSRAELRKEYGERGLERAKIYAWEKVTQAYEQIYETVSRKRITQECPVKILYLQSTSEIGGSDITLLRTLEVLDKKQFEPHVVLPHEGPLMEAFRKAGCRVHILPSMRKLTSRKGIGYLLLYLIGYFAAVLQLVRLIRREGINLVHSNTIHNLYGFMAALLSRRPHVWHVREIVVQSRLMRSLETYFVRRFSSRFIVMSDAIAEAFKLTDGSFPPNLSKLYDGIDLEEYHPRVSGDRIRKELGLSDDTPLVGIVCRLDPWKGLDVFLKAAALIHQKRPDARFLICGGEIDGHEGYEASLRRQVEALGLDRGAVFFTGWRYRHRDIPEVYGAMDVSVQCPVYPEPYGLANIEAMSCGIPVVAIAQGGPMELCVHGETAILVPPNAPSAVAEAVFSLLKDPARAQAMGTAGRQRVEKFFDRRQCVKALEALCGEVLAGR